MKKIETTLRTKNIRPTAMRMLVLRVFKGKGNALSLKDLEALLPNADRVTLFRTLKTFTKNGVLHPIRQEFGTVYGLCAENCSARCHFDAHPHFSCTDCQTVHCLNKLKLPRLDLPIGFKSTKVDLTVEGICKNCTT